jgi:acyl transferase domain-containing protein
MNTDHEQGFGGTNAHCILENYDTTKTELTVLSTPHHPFVFSATSKKTLLMVLQSYMTYLSTRTVIDLRALSHTLCVRRTAHPFRISLSARDTEELRVKLESVLQKRFQPNSPRTVAFCACADPGDIYRPRSPMVWNGTRVDADSSSCANHRQSRT